MKKTIILYHGGCPDGFGAAYAAWKKLGNSAEYIPLKHGKPAPEVEAGNDLYFIDFCYPKEIMDAYAASAASVTVLDHHLGMKQVVDTFPGSVFDNDHSGAVLSWKHFNPDAPVPALLEFIEDGDLYKFALPDSRAALAYIYVQPYTFAEWDALAARLEDPAERTKIIETGTTYRTHYSILSNQIADGAELVMFEGQECYLASASSAFVSDVGNMLARKKGPFAIVAQVKPDGIRIGIRGDGSVDVAEIARKYGGNGHPSAAGFNLPFGTPIPWTPIKTDEDSRD